MGRAYGPHMHACTHTHSHRLRAPLHSAPSPQSDPSCPRLAIVRPSICTPLSAHLSLHHRTAAPPFRACRTRLTLSRPLLANPDPNPNPNPNPDPDPSPNPNQAKAGWLAGHDPDEESSLDLLPPEWRWQSGGAQHGAGTGAVRAAPLQRPHATHSDYQLTPYPHCSAPCDQHHHTPERPHHCNALPLITTNSLPRTPHQTRTP